jgi:hypothetical protein
MRLIVLCTLILGLTFNCFNQSNQKPTLTEKQDENQFTFLKLKDKEEIQNLIKQVLKWADSENSIDLIPILTDNNDSIYIGFNLEKHKQNLNKLKSTGFFASEFIDNYNQIILTLDSGLKSGEYEQWLVGDLPPFIFANDANPWCMCQANASGETDTIEVFKIEIKSGEILWKWGTNTDWTNYKIRVIKQNEKWKIAYMQGFDFKESTRKDGQL